MESTNPTPENDDNTIAKEAIQCEIGLQLKQAREEKELSIDDVIKELKFSKTFLEALEQGDWSALPGDVYAFGFLKQYAQLLELDLSQQIESIKNTSFDLVTPLTYPDAPISPSKKLGLIAVVLFLGLIITANFLPDDDTPSQIIATNSEEGIIIDEIEQKETVALSDLYSSNVKTEKTSALPEEPYTQPIQTVRKSYSFYAATDDVWLQIFERIEDQEPALLKEALLKKGQSFSIIDTPAKLLLTAGNARSLEILEGEKVLFAAGTLGKPNRVLKRFLINP